MQIAMIDLIFVKSILLYKTMAQFQFQTNLEEINIFNICKPLVNLGCHRIG